MTGTAPPFTRMVPAASRLIEIELPFASPNVDRMPGPGMKLLTIAMLMHLFAAGHYRPRRTTLKEECRLVCGTRHRARMCGPPRGESLKLATYRA